MSSSSSTSATSDGNMASTSKIDLEFEDTVNTLGKMMIGCKRYKLEDCSQNHDENSKNQPSCSADSQSTSQERRRCSWTYRLGRYTPYSLPKKAKTRIRSMSMSELDYNALSKIRWKGDKDLDYLKLAILDEKKSISCGIEAARPPTPDIEIDELTEYFTAFVRVEMKMSALVDSLYS